MKLQEKIKRSPELSRILAKARARGKKVVFTNGCFDILHVGHVDYLSKAKAMGDILVVGLNSDSSVRRLKGACRPVNRQLDRAKVLSALGFVDYITIFGEGTPEKLIKILKPNVLVKGGDWRKKDIAGAGFVTSCGGKVATIKFVKGYSTTSTIKRIAKN